MESLKDQIFNTDYFLNLAASLKDNYPSFNSEGFLQTIANKVSSLELMERLVLTSQTLREYLPQDYLKALAIIKQVAPNINGFAGMVFPDFVARFGLDYYEESMEALHFLTRYSSSEFAVRHFFKLDFERTLAKMTSWANDDNYHVRRLASEGSRPRLPWSFKLKQVEKDPNYTLPILDLLKEDDSEYVKKSVANHLNDISKVHPHTVIEKARIWGLDNDNTAWILKRGLRTLIKNGDNKALEVFGVFENPKVSVYDFQLSRNELNVGEDLTFSFSLISEDERKQKLIVDFIIHYVKKNGSHSQKVFKLKELVLEKGESKSLSKKLSFKDLSTRTHHPGEHLIEIMVNGNRVVKERFQLN